MSRLPVIKPLALLREFEHLGARITDGAEHPAVLGQEGVGMSLEEDHVRSLRNVAQWNPFLDHQAADGQRPAVHGLCARICARLVFGLIRQPVGRLTCQ